VKPLGRVGIAGVPAAVACAAFGGLAVAQPVSGTWPQTRECSNISPSVQRRCIARRIDAKQQVLSALYPKALRAVGEGYAKWGRGDQRLNPKHFVEAHRDWRRYVESNCTALGAFGGGSNSSIGDRLAECHERELDERIQLYRQLAEGTYGL
jgi:hypothetical protein